MQPDIYHELINTMSGSYNTHKIVVLLRLNTCIVDLRLHVLIYTGRCNHSTCVGIFLLRLNTCREYLRLKVLDNNRRSWNNVGKRHMHSCRCFSSVDYLNYPHSPMFLKHLIYSMDYHNFEIQTHLTFSFGREYENLGGICEEIFIYYNLRF